MAKQTLTALGMMSGTSMDGIDVALVETDGKSIVKTGASMTFAYDDDMRSQIRACLGAEEWSKKTKILHQSLTKKHAEAVEAFLQEQGLSKADIDVVGFHGQTLSHAPERKHTWQIGDGQQLADWLGLPVVYDFRTKDVQNGGQGAPLVPLYHQALAAQSDLSGTVAILNIGGVSNVTWLKDGQEIWAFDTGPGNALIDDWVFKHTQKSCDESGALAAAGAVDQALLNQFLEHDYFKASVPKSLDRDSFAACSVEGLSVEDGAATLTAFTVQAVKMGLEALGKTDRLLVTGGGRHNKEILRQLAVAVDCVVEPVEAVSWDGDALEAEAFAYLAVRSLLDLPICLPSTTGAETPSRGGRLRMPQFAPPAHSKAVIEFMEQGEQHPHG